MFVIGVGLLLSGGSSWTASAQSSLTRLQLSSVRWGDVQVGELQWRRHQSEASNSGWQARLNALRYADYGLGDLQLDCDQGQAETLWSCHQGRWQWHAPSGATYQGELTLAPDAADWLLLSAPGFRLNIQGQGEALRWSLQLTSTDLEQWRPWWPQAAAVQPLVLEGELELKARGSLSQAQLEFTLSQLNFDSEDGRIASAGLDLRLQADVVSQDGHWQWQSSGEVGPGVLLWNDLYLDLSERQAQLELNIGAQPAAGTWTLEHLAWRDPSVISLVGHGEWSQQALQYVQVEELSTDLARLSPAYLSGWLASAALHDLQLSGALAGKVHWRDSQVQDFDLHLGRVQAIDGRQRFALRDVNGDLSLAGTEPQRFSRLNWQALEVWGVAFDASSFVGLLQPASFELTETARLPLLDGALRFDQLEVRRRSGAGWQVRLDAEIEPISMQRLTDALQWPSFGGRLSGRLPGASYNNGVLQLDGALDFQIFSGRVALSNLALERTFGSLPSLSGDLQLERLDLEQLTQAFSFGRITGLLDGSVDNLRLLNWRPVAFDARFETVEKGRISQRAVDNLSRIGGGGGAAMSGIVALLFDDFPYRKLGLSCRLRNNICHMGGVAPSEEDNAYYLVIGRSLPRITIKGFQKQVDWPRLVAQLLQIIEGTGSPQID
ncbi:MAG: hypothetical protein Tsb002_24490 [Wenzhouxiangellaceae bacterium]